MSSESLPSWVMPEVVIVSVRGRTQEHSTKALNSLHNILLSLERLSGDMRDLSCSLIKLVVACLSPAHTRLNMDCFSVLIWGFRLVAGPNDIFCRVHLGKITAGPGQDHNSGSYLAV